MTMTLQDRAIHYARVFPDHPAAHPRLVREDGRDVLYATWLIGAAYGSATAYYGSYPRTYLDRVHALFPDAFMARPPSAPPDILHAFSGSLPPSPSYVRLDVNDELGPDVVGSVYDCAHLFPFPRSFGLILADPPYSATDAEEYGTPMVDRRRVIEALASVTRPGGHLVWLDQVWPMHNKRQWVTVGRITLIRSTNHRVRLVSIFERQGA